MFNIKHELCLGLTPLSTAKTTPLSTTVSLFHKIAVEVKFEDQFFNLAAGNRQGVRCKVGITQFVD